MTTERLDLAQLQRWIARGTRVLDLGCGNGDLLRRLRDDLDVDGVGVDIDPEGMRRCMEDGLAVIEQNLDEGLESFEDDSFDTVVMTFTLQNVSEPKAVLQEMLRVGRRGVVTFPNYGYWRCRWRLAARGRMPAGPNDPSRGWHALSNIHPCSAADFEDLCDALGIRIDDKLVYGHRGRRGILVRALPNLYGQTALYLISKQ